jgi:hypothetical protein
MCCVKSNNITKITTFCILARMALEYVLHPPRIHICLCISVKVFVCLFAIAKQLQQLQNILLSFLTKEKCLPEIKTELQTYCYYIVLRFVTKFGHTQIANLLPIFHASFSEVPIVSTSMQLRHYIYLCLMLHTSTCHQIH